MYIWQVCICITILLTRLLNVCMYVYVNVCMPSKYLDNEYYDVLIDNKLWCNINQWYLYWNNLYAIQDVNNELCLTNDLYSDDLNKYLT